MANETHKRYISPSIVVYARLMLWPTASNRILTAAMSLSPSTGLPLSGAIISKYYTAKTVAYVLLGKGYGMKRVYWNVKTVLVGTMLAASGPAPVWAADTAKDELLTENTQENTQQSSDTDEPQELLRKLDDDHGVYSFVLENDYFAGTDDGYTNGFRASWLSPETDIPWWMEEAAYHLPFFASEGHKRYSFAFGQAMFAPDDLRQKTLNRKDRPYAGFLYGTAGVLTDTGYRLDNLQLTLGIVGPSSLAAQTQDAVHRVIDSIDPQGWDNQLRDEPAFILSYERKWRSIYQLSPFGFAVDITPHMGASVGNVHTYASTGATLRIGYDLPGDYGPPLIRPNLPGSDFFVPTKHVGWYLFAGFEGRAVARNIFLDGNTFRDSHSVDKKILVGGIQAGVAITYKNTRVAYTHILRTKEFYGQDKADEFGAVTLSYRF